MFPPDTLVIFTREGSDRRKKTYEIKFIHVPDFHLKFFF